MHPSEEKKEVTLESDQLIDRFAVGLIAGLFVFLFFFPTFNQIKTYSWLASWTWHACNPVNGFVHGRFVPVLFAFTVWWWWHGHRGIGRKPSYWGLAWIIPAMGLWWAAVRISQPRLALLALPFLLIGLVHYWWGAMWAKGLAPSAFFLWFLIPLPGLESLLSKQVKVIEIESVDSVARWLGIDFTRIGWGFEFDDPEFGIQFRYDSPLYLIQALMTGALAAVVYRAHFFFRWLLIVLAIFFALIVAVLRDVLILWSASKGWNDLATGLFFDLRGLPVMIVVGGGLLATIWVLNRFRKVIG